MTVLDDMPALVRRIPWPPATAETPLTAREWLVTNGLGGYASGTVEGWLTRRFHGLLIAALPAPFGRMLLLARVVETLHVGEAGLVLHVGGAHPPLSGGNPRLPLREFALDWGLPVWRYANDSVELERRVWMSYGQNSVRVGYRLVRAPAAVRLAVRPQAQFRQHHGALLDNSGAPYALTTIEDRFELSLGGDLPTLRLAVDGAHATFLVDPQAIGPIEYAIEADRGYDAVGTLHSPGEFAFPLEVGRLTTALASTESWSTARSLSPEDSLNAEIERRKRLISQAPPPVRQGIGAELALAADQFLVLPAGRTEDHARARAIGEEARTVIAGYPWFTDWGRDTMISLEGLTLATGRIAEAGAILRTFASHVRDGLVPNLFPEGELDGLYHTADASLWMFHALDGYVRLSEDHATLDRLLPTMIDIVEHHVRGTHFGIGVDPADQLLRQGAEGYQLTWMDAKVGDWVVTPRRGKAVEINALWYNALRVLARWLEGDRPDEARVYAERAEATARAFNRRFWNEQAGYLYDVVDGEQGDDPACRPNQIFAVALPYPVLDQEHWHSVLNAVARRLVTPVGLRTLDPGHPDYRARYDGDLRSRDAAYHQGTVWAWLAGAFVDAWLRVHPDGPSAARRIVEGLVAHLNEGCIGTISEIFDADAPYLPRGCLSQAWSVAEMLRVCLRLGEAREGGLAFATEDGTTAAPSS